MKYGTFAPDGSIDTEVEVCAVSGLPVLGEHATMEQIGKSHFVRILSHKTHLITNDIRATWYAECDEVPLVEAPAVDAVEPKSRRKSTLAPATNEE